MALIQAVVDGLVASNPCAGITAPRPKPAERKSLSAEATAKYDQICQNITKYGKVLT